MALVLVTPLLVLAALLGAGLPSLAGVLPIGLLTAAGLLLLLLGLAVLIHLLIGHYAHSDDDAVQGAGKRRTNGRPERLVPPLSRGLARLARSAGHERPA